MKHRAFEKFDGPKSFGNKWDDEPMPNQVCSSKPNTFHNGNRVSTLVDLLVHEQWNNRGATVTTRVHRYRAAKARQWNICGKQI